MAEKEIENISTRCVRLNQLLIGKSNVNIPQKHLVHRDGLLDALFALYEECTSDHLRKDKHIAIFVDKFKELMVELKSLRVNLKDFEVKKIIGRGHFGEVQVVREKASGDVYAMKVLRKQETLLQQNMAFFEEERDIMAKSTSPWLTKLQYAFQDSQNLYLIMEFHSGGDMLSLLEKNDNVLSDEMCQFYLAELVLAINSLHTMGYVHRDIKPDNILIDRTGHLKLADFGSSSKLNSKKQVTSSMPVGTPDYVAPEVLTAMNSRPGSCQKYGIECDWWSLGIVTYEMVFGSTPFASETVLVTYNNIMNFKNTLKFPEEASEVPPELIDLIEKLLQDPKSRLGYDELLQHAFFSDIDWNNIQHIMPPYVPTVMSVDDTSNFDDFEPENRPYMNELKSKNSFNGKNLPFVGFTYTSPFETLVEKIMTEEKCLLSPTALAEMDSASSRREISLLQKKLKTAQDTEENLRKKIGTLTSDIESKNSLIESNKVEKSISDQLVAELQAGVKEVKQLLGYERDHRLITEKKATHLIRCMKLRQRQDALRLRAKSQEFRAGESQKMSVEEQLDDAVAKMDEFMKEKTDILEELQETKRRLVECQEKLQEKENPLFSTASSSLSFATASSLNCSCYGAKSSSTEDSSFRLISKLEKKNVELERDLEKTMSIKKIAESQIDALKEAIVNLERQLAEAETETIQSSFHNQEEKVIETIKKLERELKEKQTVVSNLQKKLLDENEEKVELNNKIQALETELAEMKHIKTSLQSKVSQLEEEKKENALNLKRKSSANLNQSPEKLPLWEKKVQSRNEKQDRILLTADVKQENDQLKSKIESLNAEISLLKEADESKEKLIKQLKEKENTLSEVMLDLRISARKEQQTENLSSSLRERNKELREKLRASEEKLADTLKSEAGLQEQITVLQNEVGRLKEDLSEEQRRHEIDKAKLQERIKAMRDSWENTKDVNQKFAKSQGQYEEISRRNTELENECDEKDHKIVDLMHENKSIKKELSAKEAECSKYKRLNDILKSTCIEIEEQVNEFQELAQQKGDTIADLRKNKVKLDEEIQKLKNELKIANNDVQKEEKQKADVLKHIKELTAELDNQNELHEAEIQTLQDNLSHYKKVTREVEERSVQLQKEISLQERDTKAYVDRIMVHESALYAIKEEAARYITQISSLKSSNLKLTQSLSDAVENQLEGQSVIQELRNELESTKTMHTLEKVKLEATIAQQVKLIDFLQAKTENKDKKKRPISRLFGKRESSQAAPPRDVEKQLETERSRCRRLQDQLSQARAEKMALQRELSAVPKSAPALAEVPVSPVSRAMHNAIMFSPTSISEVDSPVMSTKELLTRIIKPPGMKHKIPHRFTETTCMRSVKCGACLDSIHFGRSISKCHECSVVCHPPCSSSLPSTCGLPSEFMQHFKSAVQETPTAKLSQNLDREPEGWVKLPRSNKQGWDRRYLRIVNNTLYVFENSNDEDFERALNLFDFGSGEAKMVVRSAVPATELPYAATSDLPFVLKLESYPHTTCWPQRSLYIMASSFSDKQMWVSALEKLAEKTVSDSDESQRNKLEVKIIWSLKNDKLIDPLCVTVLNENIILLGAVEGLLILKMVNKYTYTLQEKYDCFSHLYQMKCLKRNGIMLLIHDGDRKLSFTNLKSFQDNVKGALSVPITLKSVADVKDCHLFATDESGDGNFICVATASTIILCQWHPSSQQFFIKKSIDVNEPCSCILFTPNSVIYGTDVYYELSLGSYTSRKFLDETDASLAGLVYGASQYNSFPVAIFDVSSEGHGKEYILCFHEMGVFVNGRGRRTRQDDMKWSRLPLSFAFCPPFLFITHFNSVEAIEIVHQHTTQPGRQACTLVKNPQYMGPATTPHSVFLSSFSKKSLDLLLIDGSLDRSIDLQPQSSDDGETSATSDDNSPTQETESDNVDLDFSFSTTVNQSEDNLDQSDRSSLSSRTSVDYTSAQS